MATKATLVYAINAFHLLFLLSTATVHTQTLLPEPTRQEIQHLAHILLKDLSLQPPSNSCLVSYLKQTSYHQQEVLLSNILQRFMNPNDNSPYSWLLAIIIHFEKLLEKHAPLKSMIERHAREIPDFDTFKKELLDLYKQKALPKTVQTTIEKEKLNWQMTIWWNGPSVFRNKLR